METNDEIVHCLLFIYLAVERGSASVSQAAMIVDVCWYFKNFCHVVVLVILKKN